MLIYNAVTFCSAMPKIEECIVLCLRGLAVLTELRHSRQIHEPESRHRRRGSNGNGLRARSMRLGLVIESATPTATTTTTPMTSTIRTNATAHSLRRHTSANLDIRFLDDHMVYDFLATGTSILGSQHPLVIGFCQSVDGDNTDTIAVVAAFARAEAYTPFGLAGFGEDVGISGRFHGGLCSHGVLAVAHFDEGVALVFIGNACLDGTEATKDCT